MPDERPSRVDSSPCLDLVKGTVLNARLFCSFKAVYVSSHRQGAQKKLREEKGAASLERQIDVGNGKDWRAGGKKAALTLELAGVAEGRREGSARRRHPNLEP